MYRIFSDVHQEIIRYYQKGKLWSPDSLPTDKDTILILAGDIDLAKQIPKTLNLLAESFKAVIHVAGNHEYYGSDLVNSERHMSTDLANNVYHLNNQVVTIDGQKFIGCTMWTDLQGREWHVQQVMNDYRCIRVGGSAGYRKLRPIDTTYLHRESLQFLRNNIDNNTIVITHHSPLSPGKQPSDTDYAYHACLEDFILDSKPKAWISGHTHTLMDKNYYGTQLIVNCVGYMGEEEDFKQGIFEI